MNLEQAAAGTGILATIAGGLVVVFRMMNKPLVRDIEELRQDIAGIREQLNSGSSNMRDDRDSIAEIKTELAVMRTQIAQYFDDDSQRRRMEMFAREYIRQLQAAGWRPPE